MWFNKLFLTSVNLELYSYTKNYREIVNTSDEPEVCRHAPVPVSQNDRYSEEYLKDFQFRQPSNFANLVGQAQSTNQNESVKIDENSSSENCMQFYSEINSESLANEINAYSNKISPHGANQDSYTNHEPQKATIYLEDPDLTTKKVKLSQRYLNNSENSWDEHCETAEFENERLEYAQQFDKLLSTQKDQSPDQRFRVRFQQYVPLEDTKSKNASCNISPMNRIEESKIQRVKISLDEPTFACENSKQSWVDIITPEYQKVRQKSKLRQDRKLDQEFEMCEQQERQIYEEIAEINKAYDDMKKVSALSKHDYGYSQDSKEISFHEPLSEQSDQKIQENFKHSDSSSIFENDGYSRNQNFNKYQDNSNFNNQPPENDSQKYSMFQNSKWNNQCSNLDMQNIQNQLLKQNKLNYEQLMNEKSKSSKNNMSHYQGLHRRLHSQVKTHESSKVANSDIQSTLGAEKGTAFSKSSLYRHKN